MDEELTAYVKEHHCGGINYVVNLWDHDGLYLLAAAVDATIKHVAKKRCEMSVTVN